MGQALYRKYRSKSLADVIGQEHVTKTLQEAIKQQRISHAYLFTGPRGVGKTSVARILAHEINNLPYDDDSTHIDIIEIDAASNRRIDEIRELRDKINVAPTSATYKVYIIDEVHMLTREAFNALLKTLEEPPEHVVFVLATTDAHKLPDTIVSRTQRYHFKPASTEDIATLLQKVTKAEKITITPEAMHMLAAHSDGSFRDSLSLLDQARSYGSTVDEETVQRILGIPSVTAMQTLLAALKVTDVNTIVKQLNDFYNQGYQAATIAKQLGESIRQGIVDARPGTDVSSQLDLLAKLIEVPAAYDPERYLEIILLQAQPDQTPEASTKKAEKKAAPQKKDTPPEQAPKATPIKPTVKPPSTPLNQEELWSALLDALKREHNTLYGIVRMAKPSYEDENTLQLTFAFAFHQKRVNEAANRQLLIETLEILAGRPLTVKFVLDTSHSSKSTDHKAIAAEVDPLSTISNIFNGAELLES